MPDYIFIAVLLAFMGWMYLSSKPSTDLSSIDVSKATIIDVRSPSEFQAGHIKGATNIPVDEFAQRIQEIETLAGGKDNLVVLYCRSGARSGRAYHMAKNANFSNIVNAGAMSNIRL